MGENQANDSVLPILEEATQAPENSIELTQLLPGLEGWDSMGMVMFIGMVKLKCSVELTVHDLRECVSVADLQALVSKKRIV